MPVRVRHRVSTDLEGVQSPGRTVPARSPAVGKVVLPQLNDDAIDERFPDEDFE